MTDLQEAPTTEEQPQQLTLGKFLEDMTRFPQDSEIFVSVMGSGITIPIVEAITVDTTNQETGETKKVTVLMIPFQHTAQAMELVYQRLGEKEAH